MNLSILSSRLAFAAIGALSVLAFGCGGAQTKADHKPCCKGDAASDKPCCKGKVEAAAPEAAPPVADEPFKRVDAASLEVKLKGAAQVHVFDANSDERFAQGHIPGARHLRADAVKAEVLPPNRDAMVVFYCGGPKCMAAPEAAKATIALGYTNVFVMTDGIKGWEALGYPVEK